jgi:Tfp pilus assembly protein PilX
MTTTLKTRLTAIRTQDESGAILVLALVFMVVTALLVTGLTTWVGSDIKNVGTLKSARIAQYAADGAIQAAISNTRYAYPSSTTPSFCPNSASQPSTNPYTIDGQAIAVWCDMSTNLANCPISACTRIETLSAYPQTQCTSTSCSGKPFVQSTVIFDDYSTQNYNDCNPSGAQTSCGSTMTLYSNVVSGSSS